MIANKQPDILHILKEQVVMPLERKNGKLLCPVCGGKLAWDRHPFISESGFIYRNRVCFDCKALISTKQTFEEITHIEK